MSALFEATRVVDFDRLYRRHAPSVYRYTYAVLGNHADAEDVTQQTFLNAYRACAQGTKPRKAENWLLRIAHNEVRRHFRSTQRKPREVEFDEEVAQPAAERSDPSLADVLRALRRLPPTQRSALVMREFEGRSYAEMAEIMGMSRSALEAHIFRARRALAEQLEEAFTCGEAEEALLRRLDSRLPRRVARRLKAHLHDCRACVRFADVQKRQRAVLRGLSVLPIPASLFLFRAEHAAAAGAGPAAVGAGGSAAAGSGAAAGTAGIATGVVAKAAAVTAAAAVAGGVGYGVATNPDALARFDRNAAHAPAVAAPRDGELRTKIGATRDGGAQWGLKRPAIARAPRKPHTGKAPRRKHVTAAATWARPRTGGKGLGAVREKASVGHDARPATPGAAKPRRTSAGHRARRAVGRKLGRSKPARPQAVARTRTAEKSKPSRSARPAPPKGSIEGDPKRGGGNAKPPKAAPSGGTDSSEPVDGRSRSADDRGKNSEGADADAGQAAARLGP
jgi:RNA polymerase sigma factor (sigma-70 family)